MAKLSFYQAMEKVAAIDARYSIEAYQFVKEALDYTNKLLKKATLKSGTPQHITGKELLEGIRLYTLKQYGPMSKTLLEHWGVRQCEDFGHIVFNLVNLGVFGKTDQDHLDDFKNAYDFNEVFVKPFQPRLEKTVLAAHKTRKNLKNKKNRPNKKDSASSKASNL